ncbi:MAG: PadR family transcriptional regulator [Candidatus Binatia bacterium]
MKRKQQDGINPLRDIRRSVVHGLAKLLILQCAQHEPTYGGAISKTLRKFGHIMSPGTLYPLLHALEKARLLRSSTTQVQGRTRRYYTLTAAGNVCLDETQKTVLPLLQEILAAGQHEHPQPTAEGPGSIPLATP